MRLPTKLTFSAACRKYEIRFAIDSGWRRGSEARSTAQDSRSAKAGGPLIRLTRKRPETSRPLGVRGFKSHPLHLYFQFQAKFKLFLRAITYPVARKSAVLIPVIVAAVAIGVIGLVFTPQGVKQPNVEFPKGTVKINDDVITVEIAQTSAEKQRWLTFRQDKLPLDTAMLLKYDKPDLYQVWMLNIQYNLDLVWFDDSGKAVYLLKDVPPCQNLVESESCTYKTTSPSIYVLAATSGFINSHHIQVGSHLTTISV
jgi:uncharacterized protein